MAPLHRCDDLAMIRRRTRAAFRISKKSAAAWQREAIKRVEHTHQHAVLAGVGQHQMKCLTAVDDIAAFSDDAVGVVKDAFERGEVGRSASRRQLG